MTRRKSLQRTAALLLCAFLCLGAMFSLIGAASAVEAEPSAPGIMVDIAQPSNCTGGSAQAGYCITDAAGKGLTSVKVRVGLDGAWQDVTEKLEQWEHRYTGQITIADNCPVTVRVTGADGGVYEKMCYMDCFPNGTHIFLTNVMLRDPMTGSGTEMQNTIPSADNTKAQGAATSANSMETQDSVSSTVTNGGTAKTVTPSAATKPVATPMKATVPADTAPQEQETTPRNPTALTPDGQGTVVDDVTDQDGKEFFTFTTPSENTFYLVIDKQRESENVYFLDAVTESDLFALTEKDKEPEEPDYPAGYGYEEPGEDE